MSKRKNEEEDQSKKKSKKDYTDNDLEKMFQDFLEFVYNSYYEEFDVLQYALNNILLKKLLDDMNMQLLKEIFENHGVHLLDLKKLDYDYIYYFKTYSMKKLERNMDFVWGNPLEIKLHYYFDQKNKNTQKKKEETPSNKEDEKYYRNEGDYTIHLPRVLNLDFYSASFLDNDKKEITFPKINIDSKDTYRNLIQNKIVNYVKYHKDVKMVEYNKNFVYHHNIAKNDNYDFTLIENVIKKYGISQSLNDKRLIHLLNAEFKIEPQFLYDIFNSIDKIYIEFLKYAFINNYKKTKNLEFVPYIGVEENKKLYELEIKKGDESFGKLKYTVDGDNVIFTPLGLDKSILVNETEDEIENEDISHDYNHLELHINNLHTYVKNKYLKEYYNKQTDNEIPEETDKPKKLDSSDNIKPIDDDDEIDYFERLPEEPLENDKTPANKSDEFKPIIEEIDHIDPIESGSDDDTSSDEKDEDEDEGSEYSYKKEKEKDKEFENNFFEIMKNQDDPISFLVNIGYEAFCLYISFSDLLLGPLVDIDIVSNMQLKPNDGFYENFKILVSFINYGDEIQTGSFELENISVLDNLENDQIFKIDKYTIKNYLYYNDMKFEIPHVIISKKDLENKDSNIKQIYDYFSNNYKELNELSDDPLIYVQNSNLKFLDTYIKNEKIQYIKDDDKLLIFLNALGNQEKQEEIEKEKQKIHDSIELDESTPDVRELYVAYRNLKLFYKKFMKKFLSYHLKENIQIIDYNLETFSITYKEGQTVKQYNFKNIKETTIDEKMVAYIGDDLYDNYINPYYDGFDVEYSSKLIYRDYKNFIDKQNKGNDEMEEVILIKEQTKKYDDQIFKEILAFLKKVDNPIQGIIRICNDVLYRAYSSNYFMKKIFKDNYIQIFGYSYTKLLKIIHVNLYSYYKKPLKTILLFTSVLRDETKNMTDGLDEKYKCMKIEIIEGYDEGSIIEFHDIDTYKYPYKIPFLKVIGSKYGLFQDIILDDHILLKDYKLDPSIEDQSEEYEIYIHKSFGFLSYYILGYLEFVLDSDCLYLSKINEKVENESYKEFIKLLENKIKVTQKSLKSEGYSIYDRPDDYDKNDFYLNNDFKLDIFEKYLYPNIQDASTHWTTDNATESDFYDYDLIMKIKGYISKKDKKRKNRKNRKEIEEKIECVKTNLKLRGKNYNVLENINEISTVKGYEGLIEKISAMERFQK